MKRLYRVALSLAVAIALPGCAELLAPNGKPTPKPSPVIVPTQEPLRLEIIVKGEGRVEVGGNGSINVKAAANSQVSIDSCPCGCGKDGCTCDKTRDLSGSAPKSETTLGAMTPAAEVLNTITVISPASFRCEACELAVSSMRALGAKVEQVKKDGHSLYPVIRNARGKEYKLSDGYWRVGRDDVAAIKALAK